MTRTHKRKISKKHKTNKRNHKSRRLKGGKVFGQGTFGVVLGEPRIPCEDEDFDKNAIGTKKEVTKLFFSDEAINQVVSTIKLLKKSFNVEELKELNNYFILPKKICKPNEIELLKHNSVYSDGWRKGLTISRWAQAKQRSQSTYNQGTHDLKKELNSLTDEAGLITFLKKLQRIIEGIEKLHTKNIMHGDLKLENMVVDLTGNFKIIDMDDIMDFESLTFNPTKLYLGHSYAIWPTLVNMYLTTYFNHGYLSNTNYIEETSDSEFNEYSSNLFHKTFDIMLSKISRPGIKETILYEKDPLNFNDETIKRITKILASVNKDGNKDGMFKSLFKNKANDLKRSNLKTLCMFIDRYSFGIVLMFILVSYFNIIGNVDESPIVTGILKIIKECCFIDPGLILSTTYVKNDYIKFVDSL